MKLSHDAKELLLLILLITVLFLVLVGMFNDPSAHDLFANLFNDPL